jgi:hypothetical protein
MWSSFPYAYFWKWVWGGNGFADLAFQNRPPWPSPRPDLEFELSSGSFANSEDANSFTKTSEFSDDSKVK